MNTEEFKEQLSAFVDDELWAEEQAFLLRRLTQSDGTREQLARYYLISDTLRGNLGPAGSRGLSARVAAALEAEPALSGARQSWGSRLLRPAAGLAVAASVAALSVGFWTTQPQAPATSASQPLTAGAATSLISPANQTSSPTMPVSQHWERLDPEVQKRLNGYLVNHSEYSAERQVGGVLTYVRIAGQQNAE